MLTKLPQGDRGRQIAFDQGVDSSRDEDLAATAGRADARGAMHVEPDVGPAAQQSLAGMEAHANPDRGVGGPRFGGEPALRLHRGGHRGWGALEHDEK